MIVTAVDESYLLQEGRYLIKSCDRYAPEQPFYLCAVNIQKRIIEVAKKWHRNMIIENRTLHCAPEQYKARMCCMRALILAGLIEQYKQPILYLDSDIIVRGDVSQLFERLLSRDLMVMHRPELDQLGAAGTWNAAKFNSGVIALARTGAAHDFATIYRDRVLQHLGGERPGDAIHKGVYTAIDQELLYVVYEEMKDSIVFEGLPITYNDTRLDDSSVIWHGKGNRRKEAKYFLEKCKYLSWPERVSYGAAYLGNRWKDAITHHRATKAT